MRRRLSVCAIAFGLGVLTPRLPSAWRAATGSEAGVAHALLPAHGVTFSPADRSVEPPAPASRVDDHTLARAFAVVGYEPPPHTHLLVGREIDGEVGQFTWFSLGDSGFAYSEGRYWPASTVKVIGAVGALERLATLGLTSEAHVELEDDDGPFADKVIEIIRPALEVSDNTAYNRTVYLAGLDRLNRVLIPRWGLRNTFIQRRFTRPEGISDRSLRVTPEIRYREGRRRGVIPAAEGTFRTTRCPDDGNCTTLYELLELVRLLTLHAELPPAQRLRISDADAARLVAIMGSSRKRMALGAEAALGPVEIFNKTGTVGGDDRLDHGLIVDKTSGRRFLLAFSMRERPTTNAHAQELVRQALLAIESAWP